MLVIPMKDIKPTNISCEPLWWEGRKENMKFLPDFSYLSPMGKPMQKIHMNGEVPKNMTKKQNI